MLNVARGGGTNQRRADNKETHLNWVNGGQRGAILRLALSGLSCFWSEPSERPFLLIDSDSDRTDGTEERAGGMDGRRAGPGLCRPVVCIH